MAVRRHRRPGLPGPAGVTRWRPRGPRATDKQCQGGVVEISIPVALLYGLANSSESCGPWARVVADIAGQYANRHKTQRRLDARPNDRFANAALRRHVQVRDRTCVAPGCHRAARRCDQDHTIDYGLGGLTTAGNSGPLCRRHHRMKHEGGWRLEQPEPGHFVWTSPLGKVYRTRGEPVSPPPVDPVPRNPEPEPENTTRRTVGPILERPPPPPPPAPPAPQPPYNPDDDIPPF